MCVCGGGGEERGMRVKEQGEEERDESEERERDNRRERGGRERRGGGGGEEREGIDERGEERDERVGIEE